MKQTINSYQFHDAFNHINRADNFSSRARYQLFDYFEELEEYGEEMELDVIAICCEFKEGTLEELKEDYTYSYSLESDVESDTSFLEWLEDNTIVLPVKGEDTYIIQNF